MARATPMSSDEDGATLMAQFKKGTKSQSKPTTRKQASFSPGLFVSENGSSDGEELRQSSTRRPRKMVAIRVAPVRNRKAYIYYDDRDVVRRVRREYRKKGQLMYEIEVENGTVKQITFDDLLTLDNGPGAFQSFSHNDDGESGESAASSDTNMRDSRLRRNVTKPKKDDFISVEGLDLSSDDEPVSVPKTRQRQSAASRGSRTSTRSARRSFIRNSSSESETSTTKRWRRRKIPEEHTRRSSRRSGRSQYDDGVEDEDEEDEEDKSSSSDILQSDLVSRKRKRGKHMQSMPKEARAGVRQSERATRTRNNMREAEMDDIYRSDSEPRESAVKIVNAKETFEVLPRTNPFRARHAEGCEVCSNGPDKAALIYCQGCSVAYHKNCAGPRSTRDHLVTKVGEDQYVLQCRRCINVYRRKDSTAPDLSMCQDCHQTGSSCKPFRRRKTTVQEQHDRDANDGLDPVVDVPSELINNSQNVLFRCTRCSRAWHYHHLPPLSPYAMDLVRDETETADERYLEYSKTWRCKECDDTTNQKVSTLVAWRPVDVETYQPGVACEQVNEDDKQYLVKWDQQSYFRAEWYSGAWAWGVTAAGTRKSFFKRETGPKMRTEDAIPEEFLRIDIVLDIKYTNYVEVRSEEIDKARIKEVDIALIKYKGLGYEDAVWEKVPTSEDGDRWLDFVTAYDDWVAGRYIRYPRQTNLKARLEKVRAQPFSKFEKEKQPENLVGGELMKYQMDGLNWLYYQWYSQKNCILADEMGLGKTIQVIGFMATLIEEHSCYPFLIVVPNSTCANWRREIKQWAPTLRVVTYFGSATARDLAKKYEMFPEGAKDLRAHIVITSYEAAVDDSSRRIFKSVSWAGLIVDEGQRLKNDRSQLYYALTAVRAPFRLLMTGTPLQNNARELFNLLQFLDENINAEELEEKYAEMTNENVRELHDQIRPYILRRTKAQVLTFLPPLGQIIVPISMSVLQKKVYKSILARNPELLKALFSQESLKTSERASLSNILMQLRKCLCHPFVYSREIEERTDVAAVSHRNLVEASAKLQLLELLLPKLKERGHRVLIFSQFLDMLNMIEDFLDGMEMAYQRLDGTMGSLEKQKRIDQFNAPNSSLFAFLLSTRAGGVGINLATADTVIILDPDFNPHQDLQAISRAHRIGQKKKVLCFQLMTRSSVEEKIVQMGRKKMALDHVVVEQLGEDDIEDKDVESILKYGAAELFKEDGNSDQDIRYDEASISKLLDRTQMENTQASNDDTAESQFSFARVWANDEGALADTLETVEEVAPPDKSVWDKILKERQEIAAAEALARASALGRGKRARMTVQYDEANIVADPPDSTHTSPVKLANSKQNAKQSSKKDRDDDDTDFQASSASEESEQEEEADEDVERVPDTQSRRQSTSTLANKPMYQNNAVYPFERAQIPIRSPFDAERDHYRVYTCPACHRQHPRGACELKVAGVEHCGLCGLAHFGIGRTCPHIKSETQVREMLLALKNSPEKKELVELASKYLRGVKGTLVQQKKRDKEKAMMMQSVGVVPALHRPPGLAQPQDPLNMRPMDGPNGSAWQGQRSGAVPSSVGSMIPSQGQSQRGERPHGDQQGHGQARHTNANGTPFEDHEVANALQGYLRR